MERDRRLGLGDTHPAVDPTERRLLAYALAVGAASVPSAHGAIVYSGVQNLTLTRTAGSDASLNINLDGGATDFVLTWYGSTGIIQISSESQNIVVNDGSGLRRLSAGALIGPGSPSSTDVKELANYGVSGTWTSGTWTAGATGYAGVALGSSGSSSTPWGWIQITLPASGTVGSQVVVNSWAYESTGGASINAGAVPGPGALVSLALGAVGLRARRSRAA
jgi:hypothetical protein